MPPGASASAAPAIACRALGAHDRHVDGLVAVRGRAPRLGAGEPPAVGLAHPHGLDAAGVRGRHVQQPAAAGADHEQAVARPDPRPLLGAQGAAERLGHAWPPPGRGRRAGAARPPGRARSARTRRSRRDRGRCRGSARTASRGRAGSGGTRRTARGGGSPRGRRPPRRSRRARPPRPRRPARARARRAACGSRTSRRPSRRWRTPARGRPRRPARRPGPGAPRSACRSSETVKATLTPPSRPSRS